MGNAGNTGVRRRILIVEDEEAVCDVLTEALAAHAFDVACATSDTAAYEILQAVGGAFDALVLDINLGRGTTGFDIARHARKLNETVPVIFISGGGAGLVDRFGVPGSTLVAKPFDIDLLLAALKERLPSVPSAGL